VSHSPTGDQYEIAHGEQRAVVVEIGAGLRSYRRGMTDIVDGYGRDEECSGSRGQLLIPWPNRISGGRYTFEGRELQLPVNEARTGSAIHGLTQSMSWRAVSVSADTVSLALDLHPEAGYPFELALEVTYTLAAAGLTVRTSAVNRGDTPCPYGAGSHPYVSPGDGLIDDALLSVPAAVTLRADARGIPTGITDRVDGGAFDFSAPRRVGATVLDTAFTDFRADADGITRISLASADSGREVIVWMDGTHRYAMIYSGDTLADVPRRRHGLAIEPMTCAPDAFNSGAGLVVLEPGESHSGTWGITDDPRGA
jgi:aldose 1-epimerase